MAEAAKAEAHFRAVCAKWLDDATWQHVMTPVVGALQTLAKEEQASRVLEVAKEGLSPEDEEEVSRRCSAVEAEATCSRVLL